MPDTRPDHRGNDTKAAERIAAARAHRPAFDHNGRPTGPPVVYRYGTDQLLDSIEPDTTPATS